MSRGEDHPLFRLRWVKGAPPDPRELRQESRQWYARPRVKTDQAPLHLFKLMKALSNASLTTPLLLPKGTTASAGGTAYVRRALLLLQVLKPRRVPLGTEPETPPRRGSRIRKELVGCRKQQLMIQHAAGSAALRSKSGQHRAWPVTRHHHTNQ